MGHKLKSTILLAAILLLSSTSLPAQDLSCGTILTTESNDLRQSENAESQNSQTSSSSNSTILYFAIQHHYIRPSSGTSNLPTLSFEKSIDNLNNAFKETRIQFYACGSANVINSDTYYNFVASSSEASLMSAHQNPDAINIYYFNSIFTSNNGYVAGYAYYPEVNKNFIAIKSDNAATSTEAHELGHFFGLPHTFETANGVELVNRNNDNCDYNGDKFCDTPADLNPFTTPGVTLSNCEYTGTLTDGNGDLYDPDTRNYMSYYGSCTNKFSSQQIDKMNTWAVSSKRNVFIHTTHVSQVITSDVTISGVMIHAENTTITSNSDVVFESDCGPVIIEKEFELTIGSTLEIN